MNGATIGSLNLYVKAEGSNKTQVWTRSGSQGDQWLVSYVDVEQYLNGAATYVVMFEAVRGSSYTGDIALDDITFGQCGE